VSAQGIRAGRAFVEIGAVDKFSAVLAQAEAKMRSFSAGAAAAAAQVAAPGLALAAPYAAATAIFANFDDQMRQVGAVAGASAPQLAAMSHTAEELGRTTSYTAAEVASLMAELGRGGFNPEQINVMTASVLSLARATGTDAARSAEIVTETINQFGLAAADGARVADVLALAANRTNTSVDGLGESLKYAGPVAADLGMTLEDTVAILGSLGNAGIKGSDAGTSLRRLGVIAAATGEDLQSIFGVSNVDATGKLKPLVQVLDDIGAATANMDVEERVSKFEQAFGLLGITAASVISRTGSATQGLAAELENAGGTATRSSAAMDAGIGGAMRRFMSATEGVSLAVGKQLAGAFSAVADSVSRVLGDIAAWVEENQTAVIAVAAFSSASLALAGVLLTVAIAAKAAVLSIVGFNLLVSVTVLAAKSTLALGLFARMMTFVGTAARVLHVALLTNASTLGKLIAIAKLSGVALFSLKAGFLGNAGAALIAAKSQTAANTAMASTPIYATVAAASMKMLRGSFSLLSTGLSSSSKLLGLFRNGLSLLASTAKFAWIAVLSPALVFVAKAAAVVGIIYLIGKAFGTAAQRAGTFSGLFSKMGEMFSQLLAVVKVTFGGITTAISNGNYGAAVAIMWAGIKAGFWTGVEAVMEAVKYFLVNGIKEFWNFGKSLLSVLWDAFKAIPGLLMSALSGGKSLVEALTDALSGNVESYLDMYSGVSKRSDNARKELSELVAEQDRAAKSAEVLAEKQQQLDNLREAMKQFEQDSPSQEKIANDESVLIDQDKTKAAAMDAEIAKLKEDLRSKGLKQDEIDARAAADSVNKPASRNGENTKEIKERIAALNEEASALNNGEEATERLKFAQQANNDATLMAAYDKAVASKAEAQLASDMRDRITALQEEAFELKHGADAAERHKLALMGVASEQLKALKIAQDTAEQARKADQLKQDGASLKDSLRNPLEVFRDEWAKFQELSKAGAIDDETLTRAQDKARKELFDASKDPAERKDMFASEQARIAAAVQEGRLSKEAAAQQLSIVSALMDEAAKRGASTGDRMTKLTSEGTFSGFAAARLSGQSKSDQLQNRIALATEANVKETIKTREAIEKNAGGTYSE
jgi:TP901 family phage tail tape measure protein